MYFISDYKSASIIVSLTFKVLKKVWAKFEIIGHWQLYKCLAILYTIHTMIHNSCDIDWRVWCCWQYFVINKSIIIGDCWCCFKSHVDCLALQQAQDRYSLLPDMLTTSPESSSLASTLVGFIDSTLADTGRYIFLAILRYLQTLPHITLCSS